MAQLLAEFVLPNVMGNNLLPWSSKKKFQNYFKVLWRGKSVALEQMISFALKNGAK